MIAIINLQRELIRQQVFLHSGLSFSGLSRQQALGRKVSGHRLIDKVVVAQIAQILLSRRHCLAKQQPLRVVLPGMLCANGLWKKRGLRAQLRKAAAPARRADEALTSKERRGVCQVLRGGVC